MEQERHDPPHAAPEEREEGVRTIVAEVPLLGGVHEIEIRGGRIAAVRPSRERADRCVGPTLFDIQVNGYAGRTCRILSADKEDALSWIGRALREQGVGWWMPTITTASAADLLAAFGHCARALEQDRDLAASVPGLHLEGPYISPVDGPRGAHLLEHVRPPDWEEFQRLQDAAGGRIRLVTVAPEVEGAIPFIERCVACGVVVALGHTDLDRDSLAAAVRAGTRLSTHLGNGAHDMLQRHHNYLWYQLACRDTYASFIADGHHLPGECLYSMLRAKGTERSILVSDSVLLGGMPAGSYTVRGRKVEKSSSGRIALAGTPNLAGSASNLRQCTQIAMDLARLAHDEAWRLASLNPARLLDLDGRLGIAPGCEASLTVYRLEDRAPSSHIEVLETWVAGRRVYQAGVTATLDLSDAVLDAELPI